jgi:hypothetical protein
MACQKDYLQDPNSSLAKDLVDETGRVGRIEALPISEYRQ